MYRIKVTMSNPLLIIHLFFHLFFCSCCNKQLSVFEMNVLRWILVEQGKNSFQRAKGQANLIWEDALKRYLKDWDILKKVNLG